MEDHGNRPFVGSAVASPVSPGVVVGTLRVAISQEAQRRAVLTGRDAHDVQTFALTQDLAPRVLALGGNVASDGKLNLAWGCALLRSNGGAYAWEHTYGSPRRTLDVPPATAAEALVAIEAWEKAEGEERDRRAEERRAREEAEREQERVKAKALVDAFLAEGEARDVPNDWQRRDLRHAAEALGRADELAARLAVLEARQVERKAEAARVKARKDEEAKVAARARATRLARVVEAIATSKDFTFDAEDRDAVLARLAKVSEASPLGLLPLAEAQAVAGKLFPAEGEYCRLSLSEVCSECSREDDNEDAAFEADDVDDVGADDDDGARRQEEPADRQADGALREHGAAAGRHSSRRHALRRRPHQRRLFRLHQHLSRP